MYIHSDIILPPLPVLGPTFDGVYGPYNLNDCILLGKDEGGHFTRIHGEPESGTLITSPLLPQAQSENDRVYPVGILSAQREIGLHMYSVAIPIRHSLDVLSQEEYCGGNPVRFLHN